jgi:hypothetical protein
MLRDAFKLLEKSEYESTTRAQEAYFYERRIAEILPKMEVTHTTEKLMGFKDLVLLSGAVINLRCNTI